jgi:hypothetical protein
MYRSALSVAESLNARQQLMENLQPSLRGQRLLLS